MFKKVFKKIKKTLSELWQKREVNCCASRENVNWILYQRTQVVIIEIRFLIRTV
jgi:hypothetical protein